MAIAAAAHRVDQIVVFEERGPVHAGELRAMIRGNLGLLQVCYRNGTSGQLATFQQYRNGEHVIEKMDVLWQLTVLKFGLLVVDVASQVGVAPPNSESDFPKGGSSFVPGVFFFLPGPLVWVICI